MSLRCKIVVGTMLALVCCGSAASYGQQNIQLSATDSVEVAELVESGSKDLLREIALASIPESYENTKHWGQTKRMWDGVHLSLDGLRLKTKRRYRKGF